VSERQLSLLFLLSKILNYVIPPAKEPTMMETAFETSYMMVQTKIMTAHSKTLEQEDVPKEVEEEIRMKDKSRRNERREETLQVLPPLLLRILT
jgi:hypothetical protein